MARNRRLDSVQPLKKTDAAEERRHRLDVPLEHGQAWFSTLNQARLMLDLKYKLHEPKDAPEEFGGADRELHARRGVNPGDPDCPRLRRDGA